MRNAPDLARLVQDAGAAAVSVHGRTAEQSYKGLADWELVAQIADDLDIPVFGSGDCVEPQQIVERMRSGVSGVLVGRGVLRNPWILAQAAEVAEGRQSREIPMETRGQFLLDYIDLLLQERLDEAEGFRHTAPASGVPAEGSAHARGHDRWVINKIRALCSWYTKGIEGGSALRVGVNSAENIQHLRDLIAASFFQPHVAAAGA
jgi:tRNA-dihydrouridine synthase B